MSEQDYWCLFCGENGPRWSTSAELFNHMINTVHNDERGNMIFFAGGDNDG